MSELTNEEYKQVLRDILEEAKRLNDRKEQIKHLKDRISDIEYKTYQFLLDGITPRGKVDKDEIDKYCYNVSFRIPVTKTIMGRTFTKTIGFFFDVYSPDIVDTRVHDYDNLYPYNSGHKNILLIMDFSEDIIAKCKQRMKLTKYNSKYNLSLLIDTLYTLSIIRGNKYFYRDGVPPVKKVPGVDRMTGKKKKVRGSAGLNVGFKIAKVTTE